MVVTARYSEGSGLGLGLRLSFRFLEYAHTAAHPAVQSLALIVPLVLVVFVADGTLSVR